MARETVTYEQVEIACNQLRAEGVKPSVRLLVQRLGGSNTTILEHMKKWRTANPASVSVTSDELPADVVASLQSMRDRAQSSGRADFSARLAEAETERDDLARENKQLQADSEGQGVRLVELTTERDTLLGRLNEQAVELSAAKESAAREQAAAEAARVELAKAQLKIESATTRLTELQQDVIQLRGRAESLHTELRGAEQAGAVSAAKLEAEIAAKVAAESHVVELQARIEHVQQAAAQAHATSQEASTRAATAEATVAGLREQLTQSSATQTMLREMLARPQAADKQRAGN